MSAVGITTLYRPVGKAEFQLIESLGFKAFPPRLPEQPFFYPVLNRDYASKIARDWNTNDSRSGYLGYVLKFAVQSKFLDAYEIHTVGASEHKEYWIPASNLPRLNESIVGKIELLEEFRGNPHNS